MSKKNRKKSHTVRQSQGIMAPAGQPRNRGRMAVPIIGLIILVAVVFIWFGRGTNTAISGQPEPKTSQIAEVAEETTPPVTAPNQTTSTSVPAVTPTPQTVSSKRGPIAQYPELSHDFGTIVQGASVAHTFVVKNVGDEPLKLISAKGS